jgi:hypothetical protein
MTIGPSTSVDGREVIDHPRSYDVLVAGDGMGSTAFSRW